MSTIAVIANGIISDFSTTAKIIKKYEKVIAVDGGIEHCKKMNIIPDCIVGDFDSAAQNTLRIYKNVKQYRYPKDKDKTDLELALEISEEDTAKKITVFAAMGNRIDHTLANIYLLTRYKGRLFLENEQEILFVIKNYVKLSTAKNQIISLLPLHGKVSGISTSHLKWNLKNSSMDKNFFGISNICLKKEIEISVKKGDLLCILQKS
ncbi:MAG: thiamine diphosphokinase [Simkaniaceae bacterium]